LKDEVVPDDAMVKYDIAVDDDNGLLRSEVRSSKSKEGPECIDEQRIKTGTAMLSDGEISHETIITIMDSETSTVEVCVRKNNTDLMSADISESQPGLGANRDLQTVDDDSALDAVQSAELPAACQEAGRTVQSDVGSSAVNASDAIECYNRRNVQNSATVDGHSSCKEPTEERSITRGKHTCFCAYYWVCDVVEQLFSSYSLTPIGVEWNKKNLKLSLTV